MRTLVVVALTFLSAITSSRSRFLVLAYPQLGLCRFRPGAAGCLRGFRVRAFADRNSLALLLTFLHLRGHVSLLAATNTRVRANDLEPE